MTPLRVQIERLVRHNRSAERSGKVQRGRLYRRSFQQLKHRDVQHVERERDIAQHPHPCRRLAARTLAKNVPEQESNSRKGADPENERDQIDLEKLGHFAMFEPIAGLDRNAQCDIDREHCNDRSHDAATTADLYVSCETQAREPDEGQQQEIQAECGSREIRPVEERSSAGVSAESNE